MIYPKRGIRMWVNLQLFQLRFYGKYMHVVDPLLPVELVAALHIAYDHYDTIAALNQPGPG